MGKWAKRKFGKPTFADVGIIVAGTVKPQHEKEIVEVFEELIDHKDSVYHTYLVKKGKNTYPIVFNVYGAAATVDAITNLHDGGCRTLIFVGVAFGFNSLSVGSIVIPQKAYHFEGLYDCGEYAREYSDPDSELLYLLEKLLLDENEAFQVGQHVSVSALTMQPKHSNRHYKRIQPVTLDLELASCFARCSDLKMRTAGVLIISDNAGYALTNTTKEFRYEVKQRILAHIANNIESFHLSALKGSDQFNIDSYLADVVETAKTKRNAYRK